MVYPGEGSMCHIAFEIQMIALCVCVCVHVHAWYYMQKFEQLYFFPVTARDKEEVLIAMNRLWLHI